MFKNFKTCWLILEEKRKIGAAQSGQSVPSRASSLARWRLSCLRSAFSSLQALVPSVS